MDNLQGPEFCDANGKWPFQQQRKINVESKPL